MGIWLSKYRFKKTIFYNFIRFLSNNSWDLLGPGASPKNSIMIFQEGTKKGLIGKPKLKSRTSNKRMYARWCPTVYATPITVVGGSVMGYFHCTLLVLINLLSGIELTINLEFCLLKLLISYQKLL